MSGETPSRRAEIGSPTNFDAAVSLSLMLARDNKFLDLFLALFAAELASLEDNLPHASRPFLMPPNGLNTNTRNILRADQRTTMNGPPTESAPNAYTTYLRLALAPLIVHFKHAGYIAPETMGMVDNDIRKQTLRRTFKQLEVRYGRANLPTADLRRDTIMQAIGADVKIWKDLTELFEAAVPSLERRSFAPQDPAQPNYEPGYDGASGTLIAANSATLLADIERLNDLTLIARNVLSTGDVAQNLAAKALFDQAIFKLINVCVKVTARGFDGDAGTADEEKWQKVVNKYKELLITCLQFLNNLVTQNERRKLMLWVALFDSAAFDNNGLVQLQQYPSDFAIRPDLWPQVEPMAQVPLGSELASPSSLQQPGAEPSLDQVLFSQTPSPFLQFLIVTGRQIRHQITERGGSVDPAEVAEECKKRWQAMSDEERKTWNAEHAEIIEKYRCETTNLQSMAQALAPEPMLRSIQQVQLEMERARLSMTPQGRAEVVEADDASLSKVESYRPIAAEAPEPVSATEVDFRMTYTAAYGAEILQRGKNDLMKRLDTFTERPPPPPKAAQVASPSSPVISPSSPADDPEPPPILEDAGDEPSEDDDSEDGDYVVPGDDGRGLLTDVPLILGPTEIEVLAMLIMSGICPPPHPLMPGYGNDYEDISAIKNMHTVRCHLLLAQDNGRNLLRELLIFVAAWDLREEELYFKFMVKIMESILTNGLMPFSYHAFRESKDIISPAQAVIMKLLTNIFRARMSNNRTQLASKDVAIPEPAYPLRVDVHMVNFLFTEFRRHIIPQTCALIFLQGQIHHDKASPEDFPLNLWDMERMYEGVYQYLEFFAILTEHDVWKQMMADWEITSELVTLLKELNAAIPLARLNASNHRQLKQQASYARADQWQAPMPAVANAQPPPASAPVAVERPYDVSATAQPTALPPMGPADPYVPPPSDANTYSPAPSESEPSDFVWKNLKKLTVLVLSSLIWKNRKVQDQVRGHDGITAILACCNHDEHNPYIREHAIMCLRFLMEGNKENQDVIRQLEAREAVPSEVLDKGGYETFLDARGQVGLRRKDGGKVATASASSRLQQQQVPPQQQQQQQQQNQQSQQARAAPPVPTNLAQLAGSVAAAAAAQQPLPPNLPDWMQHVMKEMPGRGGAQMSDREKAALLAKLDRTFEGKGR